MKALEWSNIIQLYFRRSNAAYSVIGGRVWWIIERIQAFMCLLVISKTKEDPFKNAGARVVTKYLPLQVYADFS